ncbi:site-specific DNA-methyltransferase [Pseudomonas asiatica]|uniref:DNA-methyltransferase n=1 Tax=Pseudomonas asiatica TaxID=2219225 RepID=UPI001E5F6664|nr:site-specific DNA-methyltransferase [Pseudomonas asiatica]MCE0850499.1 site-specific DNA-methyltransferase [Pseudomonas asiatica]
MTYTLHLGKCIDAMRAMPDNSVDSIVTDPPYGLRFMGKRWDYDVPGVDTWVECLRVLKPGGHLLAFAGTRTQHRMAVRIEDAGFEIRDMIAWVYGSGFPKSHNLSGDWQGWGTALKPALEPITVARKPLTGTVAANVLAHGTGALNIDGCRVGWPDGKAPEIGTPGWGGPAKKLTAVPGQDGDTVERSKPSDLGRWPANLIHDGSDDVVVLFPSEACASAPVKSAEPTANGFSGPVKYSGMRERVAGAFHADTGSAARFFYCAKTSRKDRNEGLPIGDQKAVSTNATMRQVEDADWPKRNGNHHPTVKPTDLMAYLLRLVTPPGGTALDPFMGSGSTGKAAMREGFQFIGCELDPEYLAIAKARIEHELAKVTAAREQPAESQLSLFGS